MANKKQTTSDYQTKYNQRRPTNHPSKTNLNFIKLRAWAWRNLVTKGIILWWISKSRKLWKWPKNQRIDWEAIKSKFYFREKYIKCIRLLE